MLEKIVSIPFCLFEQLQYSRVPGGDGRGGAATPAGREQRIQTQETIFFLRVRHQHDTHTPSNTIHRLTLNTNSLGTLPSYKKA